MRESKEVVIRGIRLSERHPESLRSLTIDDNQYFWLCHRLLRTSTEIDEIEFGLENVAHGLPGLAGRQIRSTLIGPTGATCQRGGRKSVFFPTTQIRRRKGP